MPVAREGEHATAQGGNNDAKAVTFMKRKRGEEAPANGVVEMCALYVNGSQVEHDNICPKPPPCGITG